MILTELAPLTPDRPSSILSWIYWEKLKPMPANSLANSAWRSSTSFSFVMPDDHSSKGLSGTKNSALKNPAASLPLSGRPCWETTVITSGWLKRISRIFVTAGIAASSEMVGGIEALHGEQRYESRDRDRGGEEDGFVDFKRARQDQARPLGPCRRRRRVSCSGRIGAPPLLRQMVQQGLPRLRAPLAIPEYVLHQ